jgi:(2Fe-2S) ferredoxin
VNDAAGEARPTPGPSAGGPDEPPVLPPGASPFARHVLVCVSGGTCPLQGGVELHEALRNLARERLGKVRVRVNKSGCLGQCGHGPMVVVYPDNVWYAGVRLEDAAEIVEEHLVHGRPVERLFFQGHRPGTNLV